MLLHGSAERVHDLVAALLVGHVGKSDPMQVNECHDLGFSAFANGSFEGSATPSAVLSRWDRRLQALNSSSATCGVEKVGPEAADDRVERTQHMNRSHRVGGVIG